jgi:hypothetical protein
LTCPLEPTTLFAPSGTEGEAAGSPARLLEAVLYTDHIDANGTALYERVCMHSAEALDSALEQLSADVAARIVARALSANCAVLFIAANIFRRSEKQFSWAERVFAVGGTGGVVRAET